MRLALLREHGVLASLSGVRFYDLADYRLGEAIELYPTREEAERAVQDVLRHQPE